MNTMELTKIVGTVHHITPAPAANRSGRIKLDSGQILSAYPEKLKNLSEGDTCEFGCTETHKGGVIYYDVKTVLPATPPNIVLTPEGQRHQRQASTVTNGHSVGTRKAPMNGEQYYKPTSPRDSKRMFVCSQMNALIASRQVVLTTEGIAEAIKMISEAYDQTIGLEDTAG